MARQPRQRALAVVTLAVVLLLPALALVLGVAFLAWLMMPLLMLSPALFSRPEPPPPSDGADSDDGPGGSRPPSPNDSGSPKGGLPLDESQPSSRRLRDHRAPQLPPTRRGRPARAPHRTPTRTPSRTHSRIAGSFRVRMRPFRSQRWEAGA